MSKSLDRLNQLIATSRLSLSDQNDLLIFLPVLPEPALDKLVELFDKNKKLLEEFNKNFKSKVNILIDGRDNWEKLIEQEEKIIEEYQDDKDNYSSKNY
ncbi:MAG: hypothetical protein AAB465_01310 [Patescibacteria group bacterium]